MRQRHHPPNCPVKPWTQRARVTTSCQAGWRTQASNFPFGLVCLHNPDGELDPSSHRFTQQVFTDRIDGPLPSGCGLSTYRCQPLRVLHERKKGLILPESEPINPGMTTAPGTMRHTGSTVLCSFQLSLLRKGSLEDHFQKITDIMFHDRVITTLHGTCHHNAPEYLSLQCSMTVSSQCSMALVITMLQNSCHHNDR